MAVCHPLRGGVQPTKGHVINVLDCPRTIGSETRRRPACKQVWTDWKRLATSSHSKGPYAVQINHTPLGLKVAMGHIAGLGREKQPPELTRKVSLTGSTWDN